MLDDTVSYGNTIYNAELDVTNSYGGRLVLVDRIESFVYIAKGRRRYPMDISPIKRSGSRNPPWSVVALQ